VEGRKRETAQRERARRERHKVAEALQAAQDAQGVIKEADGLRHQLAAVEKQCVEVENERDSALDRAETAARDELKIVEESLAIEQRSTVLGERVAKLQSENDALREAFKTVATYKSSELPEDTEDELNALPDDVSTWKEVALHLPELSGPGFVLTPQAEACADDNNNRYPHPQTMWTTLRSLEEVGRAYNELGAELGKRFELFAQEVGALDVALQDSSYTEHLFEFEGREYSRLPHVKIDDAKSPNEVGRIYFALDPDQNRLIVDWFGTKPDRPKAR
jgi:hypothetical protein